MQKIKITITVEVEYTPNPDWYQKGSTIEKMIECDLANAKDDPFSIMDSPDAKITFAGSVIDA